MAEIAREILPVSLEDEMRQSYLDYAMSVIVGRALPDVRDGLKPVHRRVLYAMRELGNDWNKPYKKSARVVGDVIGKYHPHGDTAVYDTIVRMAQPFSMRYLLVDGQGNFGSVDGDTPAAMRYTEVRMSRLAHELLADIDKETVDFAPNYDESEHEPSVLPTRVPNLLINGQTGIAVGMATNIPPHNLTEIVNACLALLDDPALPLAGLMQHVPGPDFPTAGIINGAQEIATAYRTGRGRLSVRARVSIEEVGKGDRQAIIVTELPYQVNKARLLERIARAGARQADRRHRRSLRDESDKDGMRIVIELKRGEVAEIVLNNLYAQTPMETVFGINMVALQDGQPKLMSLQGDAGGVHPPPARGRHAPHDLRSAPRRASAPTSSKAWRWRWPTSMRSLRSSRQLPPRPRRAPRCSRAAWPAGRGAATARARRRRLHASGDARGGIRSDRRKATGSLKRRRRRSSTCACTASPGSSRTRSSPSTASCWRAFVDLTDILARPERLTQVVRAELLEMREAYGDARRTEINRDHLDLTTEDLIEPQDVVVTLSHAGYAKAQPLTEYQTQRRGGRGKTATAVKDEDFVEKLFVAHTHDTVLCFSNRGKVYWLQGLRAAAGRAWLARQADGQPAAARGGREDQRRAAGEAVRRAALRVHGHQQRHGQEDPARGVLASAHQRHHRGGSARRRSAGRAWRSPTASARSCSSPAAARPSASTRRKCGPWDARPPACAAFGWAPGSDVIALLVLGEGHVLTASENGYGKLTPLEDFPAHGRGGQGVIALQTSDRNGATVAALQVTAGQELMLISSTGTLVRTPVAEISVRGPQYPGRAPDPPGRGRAPDRHRARREPGGRRRGGRDGGEPEPDAAEPAAES